MCDHLISRRQNILNIYDGSTEGEKIHNYNTRRPNSHNLNMRCQNCINTIVKKPKVQVKNFYNLPCMCIKAYQID